MIVIFSQSCAENSFLFFSNQMHKMLRQAKLAYPHLQFGQIKNDKIPFEDAIFDLV